MDNGKWAYNFTYDGKRYRKQGMHTKGEANSRIKKIFKDVAHGIDANSNELLDEYYERWVEINKQDVVDDKSYNHFFTTLKKIRKHFPKGTRLKDIDQMDYQEFINAYADGLTKNTVNKMHQSVKACLEDAVYNGLIQRNPAYKAHIWGSVPEKEEKYKYMKPDQYIKTKEFLKNKNSASALLLYILHITGGRFSEANTIKFSYIDFKKKTIYLNGTKTETSQRTMSIAQSDLDHILKKIEDLNLNKEGYVLNLSHKAAEKTFNQAKELIGIDDKITISALRHTHCSFLYNHGVSIHYISKRLGHKNIRVTLDTYNHIFEETYENDNETAIYILDKMPAIV